MVTVRAQTSRRTGQRPARGPTGLSSAGWTTSTDFDPTAPLPGPPDPWASTEHAQPARDGPPFHMTDMIAAEPAIAERHPRALRRPSGSAAARLAAAIAARAASRRAGRGHRLRHVRARGAGRRRDPARGRRAAGLPASRRRSRAGVRAGAGPAGGGPRHRRVARGRDDGDQSRRSRPRARPARGRRSSPCSGRSPGAATRRHRRRDRRARPELVPHRRLPESDPRRRGGRRRTSPGEPSTRRDAGALLAAGG